MSDANAKVGEEELREICMAELGRIRQEELPLSTISKRPSFMPGRGSGTSHISQARKDKLGGAWNVRIEDHESEQMKGLDVANSRPWAPKDFAADFVRRHQLESAPPKLASGSYRPKAVSKTTSTQSTAVSTTVKTQSNPSTRHQAIETIVHATSHRKDVSKHTTKTSNPTPESQDGIARPQIQTPQQHLLHQGKCEIIHRDNSSNSNFSAWFSMRAIVPTNEAFLVLTSPGRDERVHNVLHLEEPVLDGIICKITSADKTLTYRMKFEKKTEAVNFHLYLTNLRCSALQHRAASSPTTPTPASTREKRQPERNTSANTKISHQNGDSMTHLDEDTRSKPNSNGSAITSHEHAEEDLIDVHRIPTTGTTKLEKSPDPDPTGGVTIAGAADKLQSLVQQILRDIAETGFPISEETVDEVEDVAISNWISEGFMHTEADDIKADLLELLKLLVRLKRKTRTADQRSTTDPDRSFQED